MIVSDLAFIIPSCHYSSTMANGWDILEAMSGLVLHEFQLGIIVSCKAIYRPSLQNPSSRGASPEGRAWRLPVSAGGYSCACKQMLQSRYLSRSKHTGEPRHQALPVDQSKGVAQKAEC